MMSSGAVSATTYTSSSGTLTGGASGLTLNAGGTNQNITIQDLELTSTITSLSNLIVRGIAAKGTALTVRNCTFGNVSYAMNSGGAGVVIAGWRR